MIALLMYYTVHMNVRMNLYIIFLCFAKMVIDEH